MILVLDLDDTLYSEWTFVESGMRCVATLLNNETGKPYEEIYSMLIDELMASGRGNVFDAILKRINAYSKEAVDSCLASYRSHSPDIKLFNGAMDTMERHSGVPIYLVTDGLPAVQTNKIAALGIERYFKKIFTTWSFGDSAAKPSLHCFNMISKLENMPIQKIIYVGDDPSKDFVSLNEIGATTVRVRTGRFKDVSVPSDYDAQIQIGSISDLDCSNLSN